MAEKKSGGEMIAVEGMELDQEWITDDVHKTYGYFSQQVC